MKRRMFAPCAVLLLAAGPVSADPPQQMAFTRLWQSAAMQTPYREDLSPEEKVAGLSLLWSEVKYNFVFFDRVPELDWDSLYVAYLPRVEQTSNTLEFYRTLQEMAAHLRDGHTGVNLPPPLYERTSFRPGIRTRLVEGRVLVVEVSPQRAASGDAPLHPGLEVLRVDGVPVREYAAERVLPHVHASTSQGREVWMYDYDLLLGAKGSECELELRGDDERSRTVRLVRDVPVMVRPDAEPHLRTLPGGVAHLTIRSFGDNGVVAGFDSLFASLTGSSALLIDLRDNGGGNSGVGYALLGHLTDHPVAIIPCTGRVYRPIRRAHGSPGEWEGGEVNEWAAPVSGHYAKPVVVLTSPRTGSAAEDFCVAFRSLGRGKLVGEPTAGSTGQPLVFALPGGGNATVCTARCTGPEGGEFVGVGIRPDVTVFPTIEDVRRGTDTVLEAALHLLRED